LVQFQQTQAAGVLPLTAFSHSEAAGVGFPVDRPIGDEREAATMSPSPAAAASEPREAESAWVSDAEELAERVDWYLNQLTPRQLCQALGVGTTKQAFLVLCGLPNETAEQVLALLPRRQARKVRQDMRRMGRLQLCEIDRAKQAIAEIALRLFSETESLAA
jgi:flagellar motor switch protein FliG